MPETIYERSRYRPTEIEHAFGERIHLLDDPLALTWLARLCAIETKQPDVTRLMRRLYEYLAWVVISAELPREKVAVATRMSTTSPEAVYRGVAIDRSQKAVTVGIARAGTMPSQIFYEQLNEVLDPAGVRQDHLVMSRVSDDDGKVTGTEFHGAKMGTDVDGRVILFPDPMGATGSSMSDAMAHYQKRLEGTPAKMIAVHLIVTPEYVRRIQADHPEAIVYALRYDRGLSSAQDLGAVPGKGDAERGLDDHCYIVPGAGGLGELLNNAWV